jgi:aspartyl-tRNA(Asn)/glutamyl-tRNA(Gln) amidotransferase subunit B
MQEGSFRCDANVSVRPKGSEKLGTRCEIKNLNSFRFLEKAIEFEARRQIEILEDGGTITQQTRLYDAERDETRSMRSKEDAQDYRYFPDPDLLPLEISGNWIEAVRAALPELPAEKKQRFMRQYELPLYDAALLTMDRDTANFFEEVVSQADAPAKLCANWVIGELGAALNRADLQIGQSKVSAQQLAQLIARVGDGTISGKIAKDVFEALWAGAASADAVIEAKGLKQISDSSALERIVDDIVRANPEQVAQYRAGREKVLGFFVGQAMKASGGKANPAQLNDIIKRRLSA